MESRGLEKQGLLFGEGDAAADTTAEIPNVPGVVEGVHDDTILSAATLPSSPDLIPDLNERKKIIERLVKELEDLKSPGSNFVMLGDKSSHIYHSLIDKIENDPEVSVRKLAVDALKHFFPDITVLDALKTYAAKVSDPEVAKGAVSVLDSFSKSQRFTKRIIEESEPILVEALSALRGKNSGGSIDIGGLSKEEVSLGDAIIVTLASWQSETLFKDLGHLLKGSNPTAWRDGAARAIYCYSDREKKYEARDTLTDPLRAMLDESSQRITRAASDALKQLYPGFNRCDYDSRLSKEALAEYIDIEVLRTKSGPPRLYRT